MLEIDGILDGLAEGGSPSKTSSSGSSKPQRRVDSLATSVVLLAYAIALIARNLDEGPLRTSVIQLAGEAAKVAKSTRYDPSKAGARRSRKVRSPEAGDGSDRLDGVEAHMDGDVEVDGA